MLGGMERLMPGRMALEALRPLLVGSHTLLFVWAVDLGFYQLSISFEMLDD